MIVFNIIKDWLDINYSQYYYRTFNYNSIILRRYGSSLINILIYDDRYIVIVNCGTNTAQAMADDISNPDFFALLKQCIDEQLRMLCVGHE